MRRYPTDSDKDEMDVLQAKPWQIEALKLNPRYVWWGNYEDYMSGGKGWAEPVEQDTWGEHFGLDELNELVNFYFEIHRANHTCERCDGEGLNPATKRIADDWYDFAERGRRWCNNLTDVEVLALAKAGRLFETFFPKRVHFDEDKQKWVELINNEWVEMAEAPTMPSADVVNEAYKKGLGHDAINRWVCVRARAEHQGVYGNCEHCIDGRVYDEPDGKLALQLWYIHPRKGCSRGLYIKEIKEDELPQVVKYLKEAAERNTQRFSNLNVI